MKFNRRLLEKLLILLAILTPVCIALRLFTYWNELNVSTGFFLGASTGCLLFNIFAFLVFFLCLCFSFSKKGKSLNKRRSKAKEVLLKEDELLIQTKRLSDDEDKLTLSGFDKAVGTWSGTLSAFAPLFLALAFICFGVAILLEKENYSNYYQLALTGFSFLSSLFFLFLAFKNTAEKSPAMAFLGLSPVLWCALRLLCEYRDLTRFMNKSLYVGQFLFVISALIFFVYQAQFLLGDKNLLRPNSYAFNALLVLFLGLGARLPHLIALLGDKTTMTLSDSTALLVDLAITVFAAIKISSVFKNS